MATGPAVVYEDNHLLVLLKPGGMPVQADTTGDHCLIDWGKEYLRTRYQKPGNVFCEATHRIDRPVSGLVVLARTSKSLARMNAFFRDRQVTKVYAAITEHTPIPEQAVLRHWLTRNTEKNKTKAHDREVPHAQSAELSYQMLARDGEHALLQVLPITGRTHQIRCQLAAIDCPIRGDAKYGGIAFRDRCIALHAWQIAFPHPVKDEALRLHAAFPQTGYWEVFRTHESQILV